MNDMKTGNKEFNDFSKELKHILKTTPEGGSQRLSDHIASFIDKELYYVGTFNTKER